LKQTPLLLTIAFLILTAGGYFIYEKVLKRDPVKPWDLVPSAAVFVYEKDICNTCIDEMQESSLWQIVERASLHSKVADSLRVKLNGMLGNGQEFLISAHVTRKDDFDFVYYLSDLKNIPQAISALSQLKGYRYSERELNTVKIHEMTSGKQTFSWIVIGDVWVGSFTPFLIEDVIRTHNGKPNFVNANPEIRKLPRISGDAGNIYLQLKTFSDLFSIFLPGSENQYSVGKTSLLDIKSSENTVVFNGFSTDSTTEANYLLSIFRNQSPVSFSLKQYVPNRTVTFTSYGINDGAAFADALQRFVQTHRPHARDSLNKLGVGLPNKWKDLYNSISDEIGICQLESVSGRGLAKIAMIETTSPDLWIKNLDALSEKLSEDTVFYERFSSYVIREIPGHRFPEKLLWPLVQGFEHTFYSVHGKTVFLADNLEELKYFLEDIEQEDIWGKSVAKNRFLESTLLESNISVFINTPKIWNVLTPRLNPKWRQFVRENQSLMQSVEMSAFQFSHLNNTYYTNITVNHSKGKPDMTFASSGRRNVVHFSEAIQRIHAVKSHVSQANEILIQDSLNDLSLVSMEGKVLWKIPIGDPIVSEVQQIDYYSNGKLQYIFATHDALHIIDRLGNYVPEYPLHLPGKEIQHLSVVDYDRSKRYRFLLTEITGKLWMYDKSGNNLDGWGPLDPGQALVSAPRHHRIKGKDFIVALRQDGLISLYNRRGEILPNFPLDIQGVPRGDHFLEMGTNLLNTYFVTITRDGYRVKFNSEGKIQSRETLLRSYVGSQFSLIPERSNKSYLILQHDRRQLTISDAAGRKILVNDYINLNEGDIRYYEYGGGKSFITLTDRVQELSSVFDGNGTLLTNPPLESTAIELRMAGSEQSYVFFIHGKSLAIEPLNP
jgi:hypothetical protein